MTPIQKPPAIPTNKVGADDEDNVWLPHIEELRRRIIVVLLVFSAATVGAFIFSSEIADFLTEPLAAFGVRLYTFAPAEKFMAYLHLSVWTGVLFTLPVLCLEAALFLWPGLRGGEHAFAAAALFAAPALFIFGACLCYRLLAPLVFGFFLFFGADDIAQLWGFREYLSLLFDIMLAAGLLLQAPIILLALMLTGVVTPQGVARRRSYIILGIFTLSAILTPPDVISQVALGVPLYLLFEATLVAGRLFTKKSAKKE
ncbi:sec-independent protein translocase protein TatC [Synergistales bacterium]|nr:sec-independent protein translocase protein TatC [Synergistales bacterium]